MIAILFIIRFKCDVILLSQQQDLLKEHVSTFNSIKQLFFVNNIKRFWFLSEIVPSILNSLIS